MVTEPHDKSPASPAHAAAPAGTPQVRPASERGDQDQLRPIGPERLKALREAIRNGTYPTDQDVVGGLTRMLGE